MARSVMDEVIAIHHQISVDLHAAPRILKPPSGVNATREEALARQATSLAETAFRTGSDQLFEAFVYCCTDTLPEPAVAKNCPV